jgi:hypothetical protein
MSRISAASVILPSLLVLVAGCHHDVDSVAPPCKTSADCPAGQGCGASGRCAAADLGPIADQAGGDHPQSSDVVLDGSASDRAILEGGAVDRPLAREHPLGLDHPPLDSPLHHEGLAADHAHPKEAAPAKDHSHSDTCSAKTMTFSTAWGQEGFVGDDSSMGFQRVEASCVAGGAILRGFVSFDTSTFPNLGVVLDATLTACYQGGPGTGTASLYQASYAIPISTSAFGATASYLQDLPDTTGSNTVSVPTGSVVPGGYTQYSVRWSVTSCSSWTGRRWGSSQGSSGTTECPNASSPWTLTVTYCIP